jgi:multiple sugar transport system ATP-binding protein
LGIIVAQVVLEDVYKSYSARQGERMNALAVVEPRISAVDQADLVGEKPPTTQNVSVLRRINLRVQDQEFMVLVGPSGCGKSTLLRLIAGLEELTAGNIWVGDRIVNDLPPKQRDIAMVFQSYALYPHMTVYNNLAFGLRRTNGVETPAALPRRSSLARWTDNLLVAASRSLPKPLRYLSDRERAIDHRVRTVAQMLQIEPLLDRLPKQLSGGQKQRVALGRAMARNPQVFLMDEPLSNLDAKLRAETRAQIVKLQRQLGTTTIYVTHDQTEAMTMGDRIAVMNAGQIQQIATPLELYNRPANQFVAEFIGSPPMNFLTVQLKAPLTLKHPQFHLRLPEIWAPSLRQYDGRSLILGIRSEHMNLADRDPTHLPVQVELVEALGNETYLSVTLEQSFEESISLPSMLHARIEPDHRIQIGERLWLSIQIQKVHLFDPETGMALFVH